MKRLTLQLNLGQYVCFAVCLMLMLIIPITNSHKIIGINIEKSEEGEQPETMVTGDDGETIINTTVIGKDITGYAGPTPVEIRLKDGKIQKIVPLPNKETPEFFGAVRNGDLFESLDGKTLREAADTQLDAVSGATYSSAAVIQNIKAGINYGLENNVPVKKGGEQQPLDLKFYFTLAIILCGALIPLFVRNRIYRYVQLALNVGIIGFWGGTFISYSLMVSYLTNGITQVVLIPVCLMLITAFIYPMFGKTDHYCNWICPYGSLQELAGKCIKWKVPISAKVAKWLTVFRNVLWFGLMWLLWTGLWFDWMGYEPFAAFFFRDASPVVLGIAGAFILLSFIVNRPYCRFVCPTGTLFKLSEGRK